jgi:uncharacterized phage-associated protein
MECIHLRIDSKKTTQAVNYLARKSGGQIDKLKTIKLLFFADRYHLRKFGRPVTNDNYFAMDLGPVGSGAKDIIDQTVYLPKKVKSYAEKFLDKEDNTVKSKEDVNMGVFSISDIEALNFVWDIFGKFTGFRLKDISHKYPEWKKHEEILKAGILSVPMDYLDFFDDPNPKYYNPCHELTDEEKEIGRDLLKELSYVENAWD